MLDFYINSMLTDLPVAHRTPLMTNTIDTRFHPQVHKKLLLMSIQYTLYMHIAQWTGQTALSLNQSSVGRDSTVGPLVLNYKLLYLFFDVNWLFTVSRAKATSSVGIGIVINNLID